MIKQILVPTDGSENSLAAADYAVSIARTNKASILGLFVKDIKVLAGPLIHDIGTSIGGMVPYGTFHQTIRNMLETQADTYLNLLEGKCSQGGVSFRREIREGIVSHEITKSSDACDLIAMGKGGVHAEWHDVFLGTTVEFVVRQTHKPVLITPREYKPFSKILIAYDGSIYADKALQTGAGMAQTLKLPVTVICVADKKDDATGTLSKVKATLEKDYGLKVDTIAAEGGDHARGILEVCNEEDNRFDLLVMGAYGHSKIQAIILGSTTVRVMRSSDCPILLCR